MRNIFEKIVLGILAVSGLSVGLTSCLDSDDTMDPYTLLVQDTETIDNYLVSNGLTAIEDPSGVRIVIHQLGTGLPALTTNKVDIDYSGKVLGTSTAFDEGNVNGLLSDYIPGWQIAFSILPAGSKATLYIPSYWGYGNVPKQSIPENSILTFDITFYDIVESSQELQKLASDTLAIDTYLTSKSIDAIKDDSGLRYVVTELGSGQIPTSWYDKTKLKFSYKLLTDDTKVVATAEQEPSDDFYSRVVDYIHGIKIALLKLPAGSKATLYIPSGLGYGPKTASDQGVIVVPANSNLIVDLEFIDIIEP
jgi:FKBP-type peptidyl-prolyl cis-trans isomerase